MSNRIDNLSNISLVGKEVRLLVADYYKREALLVSRGIKAFTPPLRFEEEFCETSDELEEERNFVVSRNMDYVFPEEKSVKQFQALSEQRKACYKDSGNRWDVELTRYRRRILQLRIEDPQRLISIQKPYKENMAVLWKEEIDKLGNNVHEEFAENNEASRKNLYNNILNNRAATLGFEYDKKLSTAAKPIFSKKMLGHWRLCILLDTVLLNKPDVGNIKIVGSNETIQGGPRLHLDFGLVHDTNKGASYSNSQKFKVFNFSWFFPIEWNCYSYFHTLQELEALVHIYLTMYEILQTGLEKCLMIGLEGLENLK